MPAVDVFLIIQTQWRVSDGAFVGLDYASVIQTMRLMGVKKMRQVFEDIQVMELAVLKALDNQERSHGI